MTQREKNIKKQNNKGSSPARGTMLKPFFLLLLFLCPEAEHSGPFEIKQTVKFQKTKSESNGGINTK